MNHIGNFIKEIAPLLSQFSKGYYRYGVALFYGAFGLTLYITGSNITASIIVFALIPMFLLFSLINDFAGTVLTEKSSVCLMGSFFVVSLVVMGFAFYFSGDHPKIRAYDFQKKWETFHQKNYELMDTEIMKKNISRFKEMNDKKDILRFINRKISESEEFHTNMYIYVDFFESWIQCVRQNDCRSPTVDLFFKRIMFEFWANYRCWVFTQRDKRKTGYPADYGRRIEDWYENLPEVADGRGVAGHLKTVRSMDVCYELQEADQKRVSLDSPLSTLSR